MTDDKLKELQDAASKYFLNETPKHEVFYEDHITDAFESGAKWEFERSEKLVEALKKLEFYETSYVNSSQEESTMYLTIVREALEKYEEVV